MTCFKGVLIGFGAVLLGILVAPIALMIWVSWKSPGGEAAVSFSPMGLAYHLAHSSAFWVFILVLFTACFVLSVSFPRR